MTRILPDRSEWRDNSATKNCLLLFQWFQRRVSGFSGLRGLAPRQSFHGDNRIDPPRPARWGVGGNECDEKKY